MKDITQMTPATATPEPKLLRQIELSPSERFEIREDGVFFIEKKTSKDSKPFDAVARISRSVIDVKGMLAPLDSDTDMGLLVEIDGKAFTVTREEMAKSQEMAPWLARRGVLFNPSHAPKLARLFLETVPPEVVTAYTRNGWQRNGAFIVGERVYRGAGHVLHTEANITPYDGQGTFEDWEREVLSRAHEKPAWLFALLVGLSSPLLAPLGIDTGTAFNPYGPSGSGKTVGLKLAAGCWGRPDASGCLKSFITTLNALEGMCEGANHLGLTLDEMKNADHGILAQFAYLFGNGMGKERMRSNATMQRRRSWLLNALMSSEKSVEMIFKALDEGQAAGMVTRLVDFDATRWLPIIEVGKVAEFEEVLRRFYGVAGPEFVRRIAEVPDLRERHARLTRGLYAGEDAKLGRAARAFGQLKLVGEIMGIDSAVVDEVWAEWSGEVADALDDHRQIGKDVLDFIEGRLRVSIIELTPDVEGEDQHPFQIEGEVGNSTRERDGWFDDEYVWIRRQALDRLVNGHGPKAFFGWLEKNKIIRKNSDKWTWEVPKLRNPTRRGVRFDVERLRAVIGDD